MNTHLELLNRTLSLHRYPAKHQHVSLQAWDSADELAIEYLHDHFDNQSGDNLGIFNDDFGALGCWFADSTPVWVSDSHIAHLSLAENLDANGINTVTSDYRVSSPVMALPSTSLLSTNFDWVVIKIPRTLALLEHQLIQLRQHVSPNTKVIAAGKVKSITKGVLALFEKYLGATKTSLAKKKSRLIFCTPDQNKLTQPVTSPYPTVWSTQLPGGKSVSLVNHANVFSRQSLDIGARALLPHMQVSPHEHIVDLGCGNGVLGLHVLNIAPDSQVTFVDESYMALQSAKDSVLANFPDKIGQCQFVASNCLESLLSSDLATPVSKIFCNPPFHQQNAITDHIAWQMFNDSKTLLQKGGHLVVVGNRHLDYHIKVKRVFGGVKLLASDKKFVILAAAKR